MGGHGLPAHSGPRLRESDQPSSPQLSPWEWPCEAAPTVLRRTPQRSAGSHLGCAEVWSLLPLLLSARSSLFRRRLPQVRLWHVAISPSRTFHGVTPSKTSRR